MQRSAKKLRPSLPPKKQCKKCGLSIQAQSFALHLQCCRNYTALLVNKQVGRPVIQYTEAWRHDDEEYSDEQVNCANCKIVMLGKEYRDHKKTCYFEEQCRFCRDQLPEQALYYHEISCRKNPVAKEIRKQYPSSSDEPDSSDQQQEWVMDQDYYYYPKPKKQAQVGNPRMRQSSSSQQQRSLKQQTKPQSQQQRQGPFFHRPKRQYTLSESSSEQDQHQKFWRTYHESFNEVPSQFYVKSLETDLPGITIVISSQGRNGRILRRTVYNDITGQSQIISNHRFERHYRAHIIQNQEYANGSVLQISNNREPTTQQLAQIIEHLSQQAKKGLSQEQIAEFDRSKVKELGNEEKCIICYQQYQKDESIITLKCRHFFHEQCIVQWLVQSPLCPLCKGRQK